MMDALPCESCSLLLPEDALNDDGLCVRCQELSEEQAWERQQEATMSEPPKSLDEQHREAWEQHQELHRR